jgi:nucleoside-diphosphate-sugar epimerase
VAGVMNLHLNMNKLTVVLTGAHGFIGTYIAKRFIAEGHKVADIPRQLLMDSKGLELYIKKINPQYIFHLASYGNMYEQTDEDEIFATNIIKTYFLLKASLSLEFTAFINFSTSSVYGTKSMPMHEKDLLEPTTLYAATKAGAEYLARYFAFKYDKPIVNIRPFTVIGVGEQKEHLIPTLIANGKKGKKINLVYNSTHDFIDISDFVDGVFTVALYAKQHKGSVFNIGSGTFYSNKDVADMVEKHLGKKLKLHPVTQMREYDSLTWVADNTRLKMLGWYPKKTLEDTIIEMINDKKNS